MPKDLRTHAIVLRRTNYGESDRILNLLTPEGKIAVLARGVRKEKSRLAGSIELFSTIDITVHQGHSDLGILTSAKMQRFYAKIMQNLASVELASQCLRWAEKLAEQTDNPEYYQIIEQVFLGLEQNLNLELIKFWCQLQLLQAMGESINLNCDVHGATLRADETYFWDSSEKALFTHPQGNINVSGIKVARICLQKPLATVSRIQHIETILPNLSPILSSYQI